MNYLHLIRFWENSRQTNGHLYVVDEDRRIVDQFYSMEPPWRDENKDGIGDTAKSRIRPGTYELVKRHSKRYDWHFHVRGVKGRTLILIHHGNYYQNTQGCILPGTKLMDINRDKFKDVVNSKASMEKLLDYLPEESYLRVGEHFQKALIDQVKNGD